MRHCLQQQNWNQETKRKLALFCFCKYLFSFIFLVCFFVLKCFFFPLLLMLSINREDILSQWANLFFLSFYFSLPILHFFLQSFIGCFVDNTWLISSSSWWEKPSSQILSSLLACKRTNILTMCIKCSWLEIFVR
jgi:hypothetical protein